MSGHVATLPIPACVHERFDFLVSPGQATIG
jgi:hypothetical protein